MVIPVEGYVAFEIQRPLRGVPTDPSSQALPDSQFVMLPVPNTLNQPSNPKLIIGSPDGISTTDSTPTTTPDTRSANVR